MKLVLSFGEVFVRVQHVRYGYGYLDSKLIKVQARTEVLIDDAVTHRRLYEARADCSCDDQFCKATGRVLAAKRLLQQMPANKQDRRKVFQAVNPQFGGTAK